MAAGQYSAGTIFLQVVPVFRDTMDKIQDESRRLSRAIGDDLEKSGREGGKRASAAYADEMEKGAADAGDKAGKKYAGAFETGIKKSITSAQKEIDRLDFSRASENSIKDLDRVKRKLAELKDVDFSVDFNAKKVLADIAILEAAVKKMASGDHEINITANAQKVLADLRSIAAAADGVEKKKREIRFEGKAEFKAAERQVGAFEKKFRASMRSAADSLGDHLGPELRKVRAELEALSDSEIGIDLQAEDALAQAAALKARLEALSSGDVDIDVELDAGAAIASLGAIERKVKEVERSTGAFEKKFSATMRKAADSIGDNMGNEVAEIKARLASLADAKIGVDIDADEALAQARGLKTAMEFLAGQDVDIDVDVDLGAAIAQVALLDHGLERLSRQAVRTTATVGTMGALMTALRNPLVGAGGGAENTANAFRSFNFVILAAVVLLPALVPVLAAVGGGLLALIPIVGSLGAALGIAIIGFSGIGNALKEMGNVADEQAAASGKAADGAKQVAAATTAVADAERALADARRNAARAAADAERAVADARRSAARAIEDAYDRQKEAAESYADAQKAVREAEEDLRQARQDAADDAADLPDKIRKNAVDERQALLNLAEAQNEYNAVMADGSSTNTDKEQASVNLEQAQISLNGVRNEQVELVEAQKDFEKNGVDGSDNVKSAQEQLTDALEAQKEAQEAVADAAENTRQVQIDAARDVADALRNQRRTAEDSARAIADAQRNVARAQQSVADAVTATADESSAAMDRLDTAMDKLSPAGRKFAKFLFGLRGGFREVRDEIQERMLPGIQRGLEYLIDEYAPKFKGFASDVATSLGKIGEDTGKGLGSPVWQEFFRTYGKLVPKLTEDFAASSGNWMSAWAGLFTVIAPYADRLSEALLKMSEHAEAFFTSAKGKKEIEEFMDYAFRVGPTVVDFFKDMSIFAKDLGVALAPFGELVLDGFNQFMEFISSIDPKNLQLIVTAVLGLAISFMLVVGAIALVAAGGIALQSPLFFIGLLFFALVALYQRFPEFRKVVDKVIKAVVGAFNWLKDIVVDEVIPFAVKALQNFWDAIKTLWGVVEPYLTFIGELFGDIFGAVVWLFKTFVLPILEALWTAIIFLWDKVVRPYLGFVLKLWTGVFKAAWAIIKNVVLPVLDLLGHGIMFLYRNYIKPYFKNMKDAWESFSSSVTEAYNKYVKPILDVFASYIEDTVVPKFQNAVNLLKGIWEGLKAVFAAPVRFLINTVLNEGLIKGFNWVAEKVGSKGIDPIPVPDWAQEKTSKATGGMLPWGRRSHAVGGTLPGYNPGRDNFTFYNPQLGELNLGGGEGILRPEVVRAGGGAQWVDSLNHAALQGGVGGVQKKLYGSHFLGGVLPLAGARVSSHGSAYPYPAFDLNYPGYADYGKPVLAWKSGIARPFDYGSDYSYGRGQIIEHATGSSLYAHMSRVLTELAGKVVSAGQTIGYVGDYGNTGTPPTSHLHFEARGGSIDLDDIYKFEGMKGPKIPSWAKEIVAHPLKWAKGLVTKPLDAMREKFGNTDLTRMITGVPMKLADMVGDAAKAIIPKAWGGLGKLIGKGDKGDITEPPVDNGGPGGGGTPPPVSAWKGGILPYNGTMKYDAGGYLPPGLTSVVNLTGKPEPVFTDDQFSTMESGTGGGITYAPTFQGTRLTPADVVDDLDFAMRKIRREGRYGRNKT